MDPLGPVPYLGESIWVQKVSLSKAYARLEEALIPTPVDRKPIMEMMRFVSHDQDGGAVDLDWLMVCTAWPGEDEQHSEGWAGNSNPRIFGALCQELCCLWVI